MAKAEDPVIPQSILDRWQKMEAPALRFELQSFYRLWKNQSAEIAEYRSWFNEMLDQFIRLCYK